MMYGTAFHSHAALALELIALVSGVLLLNKASGEGFFCKKTGKIVGSLVSILAIASILCTLYLTVSRCCKKDAAEGWRHPQMEMMMPEPGGLKE